ncbi:MAG: NAD(P)-binding protein [Cyclobacteriaceae bacterium]|nr:NAD(P)-binding protein [Cyclobacteriaceae bacterium]
MESIAIIGTGIAGMGCGHFLHREYDLTFYEQNSYVGGHTNTVYVEEDGKKIPIDTGFIVFNETTYPNLVKLFRELNVGVKPTNMSFGVQHLPSGLEYSSLNLFAQKKNYFSPGFWKMLLQINRFYKEAEEILTNDRFISYSIHDYAKERGYGDRFLYDYIVPMSSALWSTPTDITLKYPARALVQFFKNHGLLGITGQFQWYTVHNGSWQYRDKLIAPFKDRIQLRNGVQKVVRKNGKAIITSTDGSEKVYDKVIFACHADQTLRLLQDPTELEGRLLKNFDYQKNIATLHTDEAVMPKIKSTWSAWNYRVEKVKGELTTCTIYDMNILQKVSAKKNYFVSINDPGVIDESKVIKRIEYDHPIFTPATAEAQRLLPRLNENGVSYFAGSYFRFGFHEDAFTSAVDLCTKLLGRDAWAAPKVKNPEMLVTA